MTEVACSCFSFAKPVHTIIIKMIDATLLGKFYRFFTWRSSFHSLDQKLVEIYRALYAGLAGISFIPPLLFKQ